jgi:protein-tyrosine phosphatase
MKTDNESPISVLRLEAQRRLGQRIRRSFDSGPDSGPGGRERTPHTSKRLARKKAGPASAASTRFIRRRMGMDITWLTDRIAVGGGIWSAENMAAVVRAGVTHILDMQIEFDDTPLADGQGVVVCWNPIDDDFEPKPAEVFERGVRFALEALEEPSAKVFIHCAAGVHRAPMMALALLSVMGWPLEEAIDLIEARRPAADFAEVYVRSVEDFLKGRERVRVF